MAFQGDSIYWVEVEKIVANPFQPRREFDERKLQELADSIRMYGVLQPLTVTRREVQNQDGTFYSEYELIAGERRLRASRLAGVAQVPVIIRDGEQTEQEKLELAIIENLQREDLNAIDRATAFQQLVEQFSMTHVQVAKKMGCSREYIANSIRLLKLPEPIQAAVQRGELAEGHARTLLMLSDRPEEQDTLFREVLLKKMSVRELERITRKIATEKVRKAHATDIDQHLIDIEKEFTETLGTRVQIQKTEFGGKLTIDYFSEDDLAALLQRVQAEHSNTTATITNQKEQFDTVSEVTPIIPVVATDITSATSSYTPNTPELKTIQEKTEETVVQTVPATQANEASMMTPEEINTADTPDPTTQVTTSPPTTSDKVTPTPKPIPAPEIEKTAESKTPSTPAADPGLLAGLTARIASFTTQKSSKNTVTQPTPTTKTPPPPIPAPLATPATTSPETSQSPQHPITDTITNAGTDIITQVPTPDPTQSPITTNEPPVTKLDSTKPEEEPSDNDLYAINRFTI